MTPTKSLKRQIDESIERDIDYWTEQEKREENCEICGHKIHPLCNGANCEQPHYDPQSPPEE